MSKGKKISIYVSEKNMHAYGMLQEKAIKQGVSVSNLVGDGINAIAMQEFANIKISIGAYLALADGKFDLIRHVCLENGTAMLILVEDAYKTKDGSNGIYADKIEEYVGGDRDGVKDIIRLDSVTKSN